MFRILYSYHSQGFEFLYNYIQNNQELGGKYNDGRYES